jgi:MFS family permease
MLGTASTVLATTIVNVAIPEIMAAFSMSQDKAQWLATGFLAGMAGTMLMTSWCVRRFGERGTYLGALSLFLAASVVGGLASHAEVLIVSRIVQGAAAGIIQPLAMITIFAVFPEKQRGRAMGIYGLGVVLAPAIGPAVGGLRSAASIGYDHSRAQRGCDASAESAGAHCTGFEHDQFIRQLGGAFGVNVLATFLEWRTLGASAGAVDAAPLSARVTAFHESFVLVAAIFLLAALPAWLMRNDRER